ncbi:MAG: short-chain dehydrogenase, partial [Oscillospiraceae bacterium]|nr:short-chain dehydrogenase [Oscillospiraceae bacterium]
AARQKVTAGDDIYDGRIGRSVARMEHDEQTGMDPAVAGQYIASLALRRRVKPLYAIGLAYKAACVVMKLLPCGLSNWIIGLLYAK